jgi:hypothetical protein
MPDEFEQQADRGPSGLRMIHVQETMDGDAVGIGIYHVHPEGHPLVPDSHGKSVGELLAAIRLEDPEHAFELAREISMCAIRIQERRGKT